MKKLISYLMAFALLLSVMPSQLITVAHAASTENRDFITLKKDDSTIAPGVTQSIATVRKKYNNKQMVYYAMTVDTNVETTHIYANYKDNEWEPHTKGIYGMQTVTKQMDAAMANHTDPSSDRYIENYTVVGGINGTGYNMSTGQTRGILVMEGHIVQEDCVNSSGKPEPFFAIMKDGTPKIFWNNDGSDWKNNKTNIREAICSFGAPLIVNGKIQNSDWGGSYPDSNARTAIGITADRKVVMLVVDGKQVASEGCDMYELALILKEAGCVDAFNMDSGGSTTYLSRPEGESTYRVVNKPCDGSPRSVSASLMVVSTAPPSDVFQRATLTAERDYVTPGSTVTVSAVGVSPAGTPADIPANAVWQMKDSALGTVSSSGVFTSNGIAGDAVIQIAVDDKVVGETTIHVVKPDSLAFKTETITVPYGKTVPLYITAYSGVHEVVLKDGDVHFTLDDDSIGTISGSYFTAGNSGTSATLTATSAFDGGVTATAAIKLGRGSEVLFDFEDGTSQGITVLAPSSCVVGIDTRAVTAETGMVHNGKYALAIEADYSLDTGTGYVHTRMYLPATIREKATRIGFWLYVPDECTSLWPSFGYGGIVKKEDGTFGYGGVGQADVDGRGYEGSTGWVYAEEASGWHYISADLSGMGGFGVKEYTPGAEKQSQDPVVFLQFYVSDRSGESFGFNKDNV